VTTPPDAPKVTAVTRPADRPLREWRCPTCGKLLARVSCREAVHLIIETKCDKCGTVATMELAA